MRNTQKNLLHIGKNCCQKKEEKKEICHKTTIAFLSQKIYIKITCFSNIYRTCLLALYCHNFFFSLYEYPSELTFS